MLARIRPKELPIAFQLCQPLTKIFKTLSCLLLVLLYLNVSKFFEYCNLFLIKRIFGSLKAKTLVHNLFYYTPNDNENFVLKHGTKICVQSNKLKRELVFSDFEVLTGQLKQHKPLIKTKLQQCFSLRRSEQLYQLFQKGNFLFGCRNLT